MAKPTTKAPCKYGATCYRKNKQHLNAFSHPELEEEEIPKKKAKLEDYFGTKGKKESTSKESSPVPEESKSDEEPEPEPSNENKNESDEKPESEEDEVPESPKDVRENIKMKFLQEMPEDFYDFWDFAKTLNSKRPQAPFKTRKTVRYGAKHLDLLTDALLSLLGLQLVGPYDVLAGNCVKKNKCGRRPCYLRHWRYYYDPPEFLTVVKGDDKSQFHMGYFRDDPKELPAFVASNAAQENCNITPRGENIFAAVNWFIDDQIKKEKLKKSKLENLKSKLQAAAGEHGYCLDQKTKGMKARDKKSVCKTFHGAGMVVPVDEQGIGYREVPETPGSLKKMLKAVVEAKTESDRDKAMDPLMEIIMLIQFANDECDYGEGQELGLCMFSYGGEALHSQIMNLLPLAYQLLRKKEFGEIITAHLKDRKHTAALNELE